MYNLHVLLSDRLMIAALMITLTHLVNVYIFSVGHYTAIQVSLLQLNLCR